VVKIAGPQKNDAGRERPGSGFCHFTHQFAVLKAAAALGARARNRLAALRRQPVLLLRDADAVTASAAPATISSAASASVGVNGRPVRSSNSSVDKSGVA